MDEKIEDIGKEEKEDRTEELEEVEELKAELEDFKDRYIRLQADFQNFRRIKEKEREETIVYGVSNLAKDLLVTMDNLERALDAHEDKEDGFYKGVELTYYDLLDTLSKHGIEMIEAKGQEFDPNYHHAVIKEKKDGVDSNIVIEELQKGYKIKDRVIRPSMVKVSE